MDQAIAPKALRAPEVLAPAGDWECVRAAVENGADAVYFGVEVFNARMRAHNFSCADLPDLMEWLHRRGVKGYITFNILVFTAELPQAEAVLRSVIAAGVDAAIVQDVGICQLIRKLSPDFPIHGSTQMTVASPAGVASARELGASLVVLARENTLAEIEKIQKAQADDPLPLEVFVHGALCVAYSGQCLTSEALGGRSANRGECAQACRMPYSLTRDGEPVDLGDRRYLLSPQDLAGVELVPELVRLGVTSLKIEGRLKQPEYVASVTRVYRQAVDRAMEALSAQLTPPPVPAEDRYELEMAFSRGLATGWMEGINNQTLVHARFPKKRGVRLGEVVQVRGQEVGIELDGPLKPGDGVVFDDGQPEKREEGGRIWRMHAERGLTWLGFGPGAVDFPRIQPGQIVWKTSDQDLERRLQASWKVSEPAYPRPISARVGGKVGEPLWLELDDGEGHVVRRTTEVLLEEARKRPLDAAYLEAQLGRLGGTPLFLAGLEVHLEGAVIVPVSALNQVRREASEELLRLRAQPPRWTLVPEASVVRERLTPSPIDVKPELVVLVRTVEQLEVAARHGVQTLYLELEHLKQYPQAIARWRELAPSREIWAAPPRVTKAGEDWILRQIEAGGADGILARGWDHLQWFAGRTRLRGDFSLNVANPLTAQWFLQRFNLEGVTISCDLAAEQVIDLANASDPSRLELILHQHMPMFHMEHCVFCAFLSTGKDFRDCGRPCEKHEVRLVDHTGASHPVKADAGCRNTVFNARAQTGAEYADAFLAAGLRRFRIEFLDESPADVAQSLDRYRRLLDGRLDGQGLWRELKAVNQLGVTRGTLKTSALSR